ncbi:MAG: hypothetical protein WDM94_02065 [Bauldia sp.]
MEFQRFLIGNGDAGFRRRFLFLSHVLVSGEGRALRPFILREGRDFITVDRADNRRERAVAETGVAAVEACGRIC